jgi:hypothetical protein
LRDLMIVMMMVVVVLGLEWLASTLLGGCSWVE